MKKILSFSLSVILALSLTSGNITASAHVEENGGRPGYQQPTKPEMGLQPGDDHRPGNHHRPGHDQTPCYGKATAVPTVDRTEEPTKTPEVTEEPTEEPMKTPEVTKEPTEEPTKIPEVTEEPAEESMKTPEVTEEPTEESMKTPEVTEEPTEESMKTPEVTEEPTEESMKTPEVTEEPTEEPMKTPEVTEEPTKEPVASVAPVTTTAVFYVLRKGNSQPEEIYSYPCDRYTKVGEGVIVAERVANDNQAVEENILSTPAYNPESFGFGLEWYIQWYVIKHEGDGWHVDGIWTQATATPEPVSTEAPVATEEPTEESDVEVSSTPEVTAEPEVTQVPVGTVVPEATKEVVVTATPEVTKSAETIIHKVPAANTTAMPATKVPSADTTVALATKVPSIDTTVVSPTKVPSTDTISTPETMESNTAGEVTVIATPASTQVTEAPATTSQPVYNDEKNLGAVAPLDVIEPEKDNAFVTDSETVAEGTEKSGVAEISIVVTTPEVPSAPVVGVFPTVDDTAVAEVETPSVNAVEMEEDDVASSAVSVSTKKTTTVEKKYVESEEKDMDGDTGENIGEDSFPSSAILPQTGVVGEYIFYVFGSLLCALGICILFIFARKNKIQ